MKILFALLLVGCMASNTQDLPPAPGGGLSTVPVTGAGRAADAGIDVEGCQQNSPDASACDLQTTKAD